MAKKQQIVNDLQNTAPLPVDGDIPGESPVNGNGKHPPEILQHSWENAFKGIEGVNSLKYLAESGDNPIDLLMRTFLPENKTNAYRTAVAFATVLRKCREAGDTDGENEIRDILALLPSMGGRSRDQIVSTLIGQLGSAINEAQNIGGKISSAVRNVWKGGNSNNG